MNAAAVVVGVDVSKKKIDVTALAGGKTKTKVLENSAKGFEELIAWFGKQKYELKAIHVCMEATGVYYEPLALALDAAGIKVSVVNPASIKNFGVVENIRNKTDELDAGLIARFCMAMSPEVWQPPPLEQRQLRAWAVRVQGLKDMLQQERNRLEALNVIGMTDVADNVRQHITWLEEEIKKLEKDISDHIDRHPGLKEDAELMLSIPGIGPTTAARILGQIGDVRRFESAKAFAAFLGVTPKQRSSGSSVRGRTMISRAGNARLRTALYMPSLVAIKHNDTIRQFAARLSERGMAKKAVIGAVMHKLALMIFGIIKNKTPFDAGFGSKGLAIQDGI
jgi:transposase